MGQLIFNGKLKGVKVLRYFNLNIGQKLPVNPNETANAYEHSLKSNTIS